LIIFTLPLILSCPNPSSLISFLGEREFSLKGKKSRNSHTYYLEPSNREIVGRIDYTRKYDEFFFGKNALLLFVSGPKTPIH
jgi:hypothetical protein